jgi:transposase
VTDATTLLLGLPGVQVDCVERWADGTRVVHVLTVEDAAAACPSCGVVSTSVKGKVTTAPRDIPCGQDRILLRWNKTRWRCGEDYCERDSFTESIEQVPARSRTTGRLRTQIGAAIGEAARSVAEVAAAHGVSWPTAHRALVEHAERLLSEPAPVHVLGIDETRRGKPRWEFCGQTHRWVRVDPWDTGFVDLSGTQGLLGQATGRTSATVVDWLHQRTVGFREAIHYVAIDPAAVYAAAIRTEGLLPNATIVVDHFHLVKLANDAVTKVRRRVTWDLKDHRGRKPDPEWANRRRLLRARERLSHKSFTTMWNQIQAEDPSAQILSAWIAKEELRTLLSTVRVGGDPHLTRHRLHRFLTWCIDSRPRTPHPGHHHRHLVARDQRLHPHRDHQRPHRGLQPAHQHPRARRVPKPRQLDPTDTLPLHPQPAGRNPDSDFEEPLYDVIFSEKALAQTPSK